MLKAFDALVPVIPARPLREVENELREIRRARRSGGAVDIPERQLIALDTSVLIDRWTLYVVASPIRSRNAV
jgi:hypothetical protein